jgi:hypothetical protein
MPRLAAPESCSALMTQRVKQGTIGCQLSNQLLEHAGFADGPHSRLDSISEQVEMGSDHRILVRAQGIEP